MAQQNIYQKDNMILKAYKDEASRQEKIENESIDRVNLVTLQDSIQNAE
jgi:hypothetical protein